MKGQFKLFRLAGITVYLHWSWFLVAIFEIQARAGAYTAPGWNILEYLALFAIVTMHEFGHALACRSVGGKPDRIMLWPFGGIAYVDPPQRPGATLWSIVAGPLVNVVLIPVLALAGAAVAASGNFNLITFVSAVAFINYALLVFNILPIYPLDGGQILRSLLWFVVGKARSLMAAAVIGFAGVALLILLGLWTRDLWLLAITAFIALQCWNGLKHAQALGRIARLPRRDGYSCPVCHAKAPAGAIWRCAGCGHSMDALAGACLACGTAAQRVTCPDCGESSAAMGWAPASQVAGSR